MATSILKNRVHQILGSTLLIAALSACNAQSSQLLNEGIGYRQARFTEIAAMKQYRQCRDEALALDRQARSEASAARYIASAKLIEKCEAELGPETAGVAVDERHRAYALSVQNYLKGGDILSARKNLTTLKQSFPDLDLYFPDGSSFNDTMDFLLGTTDRSVLSTLALVNVSDEVKKELLRLEHWKHN